MSLSFLFSQVTYLNNKQRECSSKRPSQRNKVYSNEVLFEPWNRDYFVLSKKVYMFIVMTCFHLEKNILQFWQQSPKTLTDGLSTWLGLATNQGWKIGLDCNVLTTFKNSVENQIQSRGSEWKCKGWQRHNDHVSRKRTWEGWLWFRRTLRWGFLVAGKMSNTSWRFLISYTETKRHK